MSLREEIKHYVYDDMRIDPDVRIDIIINKVREYYGYKDSDITMLGSAHEADIRADERNKVLDAAVEAVVNIEFELHQVSGVIHKETAIEAINKLRGD